MANWPALAELKLKLDIATTDWDDHLTRLLAAAVAQVEVDVGEDVDEPDEALAAAALVLAVEIGSTGEVSEPGQNAWSAAARLPKYQRLLKGHRVRFGVA